MMLSSPGILERGRFLHKAVTHPTMYVQWALIGEETIRERIKRAVRFSIDHHLFDTLHVFTRNIKN